MSEKFGLDWKKYETKRMDKFVRIMLWEGEREKEKNDKSESKHTKPSQKFR